MDEQETEIVDPAPETSINLDKFENVGGEWTFETKDSRWWEIPKNPEEFIGLLYHMMEKDWFTKIDARVLIDWAAVKFQWDVWGDGECTHIPLTIDAIKSGPVKWKKVGDDSFVFLGAVTPPEKPAP